MQSGAQEERSVFIGPSASERTSFVPLADQLAVAVWIRHREEEAPICTVQLQKPAAVCHRCGLKPPSVHPHTKTHTQTHEQTNMSVSAHT